MVLVFFYLTLTISMVLGPVRRTERISKIKERADIRSKLLRLARGLDCTYCNLDSEVRCLNLSTASHSKFESTLNLFRLLMIQIAAVQLIGYLLLPQSKMSSANPVHARLINTNRSLQLQCGREWRSTSYDEEVRGEITCGGHDIYSPADVNEDIKVFACGSALSTLTPTPQPPRRAARMSSDCEEAGVDYSQMCWSQGKSRGLDS